MAELTDVPEGLRGFAAAVPPEVMDALPAWELNARLAEVSTYYALAAEDPGQSEAAGAYAHALMRAIPVEQFIQEVGHLAAALMAAASAGEFEQAGKAYGELLALQARNPMPEAVLALTMPSTASQLSELSKVPSRVLGVK
jgi:hypothetical protein